MSASESESEPYMDTSSDFIPSNPSESSDEQNDQNTAGSSGEKSNAVRGKKRKRQVRLWERNVRKQKRTAGEEYTGYNGKVMPKRQQIADCKCRKKCLAKFSDEEKEQIFVSFNKLAEKEKQDSYLAGLITVGSVTRRRKSRAGSFNRNFSFKYKLRSVASKNVDVCKMAICCAHGIGKKRLELIVTHMTKNITPPTDRRGTHHIRPNATFTEIIKQVEDHINSFPRQVSHYSRNTSKRYYLSADLNMSIMHTLYLKKFEPVHYENLNIGIKRKPKVSYDYYCRYFRENFNMSFGRARKDTCKKCDILQNKINGMTDNEQKLQLQREKDVHVRKAEWFYAQLKEKAEEAKKTDEVESLCFDFQQNMPLPKVPSTDASLSKFLMLKPNQKPTLNVEELCYISKLPLKDAKYKNVMVLAEEYVPVHELDYYKSLKSDAQPVLNDSGTEGSDDEEDELE